MKIIIIYILSMLLPSISIAAPKIAVVDFDSQQYGGKILGTQLAEYVIDELVNTNLFEVLERDKMHLIMAEQGFSASGMVDTSNVIQVGKLLGARYLLTGKVISLNSSSKKFNGYGINTVTNVYELSVSIRIFDAQMGHIVFSDRSKTQATLNATDGLSLSSQNVYEPLAEKSAIKIVGKIKSSSKFSSPNSVTKALYISIFIDSIPIRADVEVDGIFYGNTGEN